MGSLESLIDLQETSSILGVTSPWGDVGWVGEILPQSFSV